MRLGFHLWRSQQAVRRAADAALLPLGATSRTMGALEQIDAHAGLSAAELARKLVITPQSCASVVAELERQGWIARAAHPAHRAAAALRLTPEGEAALARGRAAMDAVEKRLMAGMTAAERRTLIALLDRAHANSL